MQGGGGAREGTLPQKGLRGITPKNLKFQMPPVQVVFQRVEVRILPLKCNFDATENNHNFVFFLSSVSMLFCFCVDKK